MREDIGQHGPGPARHGWHHGEPGRGGWHGGERERGPRGFSGGEHRGGPFGGPWGGPGGPRHRERMERGILRYVILDSLREGPKHGYEIIKDIEERTQGEYAPSPGTLYPTLQYLDDLGLVESDQEDSRRVYRLTDAGRKELDEHSGPIEHFWSRFSFRKPSAAGLYELNFTRDALQDLNRTIAGGIRNSVFTGDSESMKKIRVALEKCQNEVREILSQSARGASADDSSPDEPDDLRPLGDTERF